MQVVATRLHASRTKSGWHSGAGANDGTLARGRDWVRRKYFGDHYGGAWRFQTTVLTKHGRTRLCLVRITDTAIVRHVKVKGAASPDDPAQIEYWQERARKRAFDELPYVGEVTNAKPQQRRPEA